MIPCSCAASSGLGDLLRDGQAVGERHGAAGDDRREILTLDQLHHERRDAVALLQAVDRGDVRVIERREHFGLALEPRQPVRVTGHHGGEHLDCDRPLQVAVGRAIDLPHTPRTDLRGDFVGTEVRAWCKGQVAVKYMGGPSRKLT